MSREIFNTLQEAQQRGAWRTPPPEACLKACSMRGNEMYHTDSKGGSIPQRKRLITFARVEAPACSGAALAWPCAARRLRGDVQGRLALPGASRRTASHTASSRAPPPTHATEGQGEAGRDGLPGGPGGQETLC